MPIYIDGHNLIGRGGRWGLNLADPDKEKRLLDLLARYRDRRQAREEMTVIFDGSWGRLAGGKTSYQHRGLRVEYAVGRSADEALAARVRRASRPREVTLVSSDAAVQREAMIHGARVMSAEEFLERVAAALTTAGEEKPERVSGEDLKEWLRLFGEDGREG